MLPLAIQIIPIIPLANLVYIHLVQIATTAGKNQVHLMMQRPRIILGLLEQLQYMPYSFPDQVVSIFAGTQGVLDSLPVSQVLAFESALLRHVNNEFPEIVAELEEKGSISDELAAKMRQVMDNFKGQFEASQAEASQAEASQA